MKCGAKAPGLIGWGAHCGKPKGHKGSHKTQGIIQKSWR